MFFLQEQQKRALSNDLGRFVARGGTPVGSRRHNAGTDAEALARHFAQLRVHIAAKYTHLWLLLCDSWPWAVNG